jgi:hypothetical protein
LVLGPAAHRGPHREIEAEAVGVVDISISCQTAVDRLTQQGRQGVLGVLIGAGVVHGSHRRAGQSEGVVEFPIGEKSSVRRDRRAVKLPLDLAVEVNAQEGN